MTERVLTNLGRLGVAVGVSGLVAKSCLYDGESELINNIPFCILISHL